MNVAIIEDSKAQVVGVDTDGKTELFPGGESVPRADFEAKLDAVAAPKEGQPSEERAQAAGDLVKRLARGFREKVK